MALKKTTTTAQGFTAEDAYHKVESVSIVGKTQLKFSVRSYKDPSLPAFDDQEFECVYDIQGDNPIRQAYKYLKTTEVFADAVDC